MRSFQKWSRSVYLLLAFVPASLASANSQVHFPGPLSQDIASKVYTTALFQKGSSAYRLNNLFSEFGQSQSEIFERLGKSMMIKEKTAPNRHEENSQEFYIQYYFDGITIETVSVNRAQERVARLIISNCSQVSKFQRFLCKPTKEIKAVLGQPSWETESEFIYHIAMGDFGSLPMRVFHEDGIVTSIYVKNFID